MRSVALLLAVSIVATSACTSKAAGPAIGIGTMVTALGVGMLVSIDEPEPQPGDFDLDPLEDGLYDLARGASIVVALVGVALVGAGVVGLTSSDTDGAPAPEVAPAADPGLDRATLLAYQAARAGDCARVKALGDRVRATDSDYFHTTFVSDPLLARCLR